MRSDTHITRDLADHVPGHSLIVKLLAEWDAGRIRPGNSPDEVLIDDESRGWFWGVLGERRVAAVLATLPEAFVLHSVPVSAQGTDVDHLVISPAGVFCVNTKYHSGASVWAAGYGLKVNGTSRTQYLRNSAGEAKRVEQRLSAAAGFAVPVYPVIAFVGVSSFTHKAPSEYQGTRIRLTRVEDLPFVLRTRREMSDDQVDRVIAAARQPSTWLKTQFRSAPGEHLAREFDALYEALGPALDPRGCAAAAVRRSARVWPNSHNAVAARPSARACSWLSSARRSSPSSAGSSPPSSLSCFAPRWGSDICGYTPCVARPA